MPPGTCEKVLAPEIDAVTAKRAPAEVDPARALVRARDAGQSEYFDRS